MSLIRLFANGKSEPQNDGSWADSEGKPRKYKVYNGYGYSDHLPILCKISF